MQRTMYVNESKRVVRGQDIRAILEVVRAAYPAISNWELEPVPNGRGMQLVGDNGDWANPAAQADLAANGPLQVTVPRL